jgi:hypothetical protein
MGWGGGGVGGWGGSNKVLEAINFHDFQITMLHRQHGGPVRMSLSISSMLTDNLCSMVSFHDKTFCQNDNI